MSGDRKLSEKQRGIEEIITFFLYLFMYIKNNAEAYVLCVGVLAASTASTQRLLKCCLIAHHETEFVYVTQRIVFVEYNDEESNQRNDVG